MRKKQTKKRTAARRHKASVKLTRGKRMTRVDIVLPAHVATFLNGAAARTELPVQTIIRSLLAVQVHAMCERAS